MTRSVLILGGGVAGLSAAHELIERGFSVRVLERHKHTPGGKARSMRVPGTGRDGRKELPGEHGFRFFPGFYKHVTDTMKRIPYGHQHNGVLDNLVPCSRTMVARFDKAPVELPIRLPQSLEDLRVLMRVFFVDAGLTIEEQEFFAERLWQLFTSCQERHLHDYERIGWWHLTQAEAHGHDYRALCAEGLTRTLIAAKPREANAKTVGHILRRLLLDSLRTGAARVLNGPTNDVWIDPWLDYLRRRDVDYRLGVTVERLECRQGRISGVWVREGKGPLRRVEADYYIAAVPVDVAAQWVTPELLQADPTLERLPLLARDVAWMSGIQYYLSENVPLVHGHVNCTDSPWALTAVSQVQFWPEFSPESYGDGQTRGILSVDISDWCSPGLNGKQARHSTAEEIAREVWAQLERSLNTAGCMRLNRAWVRGWNLCDSLSFEEPGQVRNAEPLLVNKAGASDMRPESFTRLPNLFLAADYVRTDTDLATMEGANEAARRAVNGIVDAVGIRAPLCELWKFEEPMVFAPLRLYDQWRFARGLPWKGRLPAPMSALMRLSATVVQRQRLTTERRVH